MPSNSIDDNDAHATGGRDRTSPSASPEGAPLKHALIIEDLPVIAISIQVELADLGFSAAIAATEAEAVMLAEERCPDLIIADVRLEEGSGIDGAAHLSKSTNRRDFHDRRFGTSGGCLSKPFSTSALISKVGTAGPMSIS